MEEVEFRLAAESDLDSVLELSRAICEIPSDEDHDFVANRFRAWLTEPKRSVFVAEVGDKIVGLRTFVIVNEGRSSVCDAERILPELARQGLLFRMVDANRDFIRKNYPNVCFERYFARRQFNQRRNEMYADKVLFKQDTLAYFLDAGNLDTGRVDEVADGLALKVTPCSKEVFADEILSVAGKLFPSEIFTIEGLAFEAKKSNMSSMFQEGDKFFVDHNEDVSEPLKSFSHGRLSPRVKFLHWDCYIYTKNSVLFQVHLLEHIKTALTESQVLSAEKNSLLIVVHFLSDDRLLSYGRKLMEGVLALKPCDRLNMKQKFVHEESLEWL